MDLNDLTREELLLKYNELQLSTTKAIETASTMALRYKSLLQTTRDGIHILDQQGYLIEANPAFCEHLGYSYDEALQLRVSNWDLQWSIEDLLVKIRDWIEHPVVFETKHRRKDGSVADVQISATGITLDGNNFLYASAREITESNRFNKLMEQTRHNYHGFFNTIEDFLWVLDHQGNIICTNNAVVNRLGYSQEELDGMSVLMVHPVEKRKEVEKIVAEMLNGASESCNIPIQTKSGVQIPVETRISHGCWDGKPAIFGVSKDITKIKQSEEKFSKLFYINPSACGLSDIETREYTEVNDAFQMLLGYDKNEVIGKTAEELGILSEESRMAILHKMNVNGRVNNVQTILRTKQGKLRHVLISAENIMIQDKTYRFTVAHDISERIRMEDLIKCKNEELAVLNHEKDNFFSIIAHDLRSPFNVFLNYTQLLLEDLTSYSQAELQRIARSLNSLAKNLFTLLENLLEWSRMQQGLTEFKPVHLNVLSQVTTSLQAVNENARQKGITIETDIPANIKFFADEYMIGGIIRNLVSNAVKFTRNGGKINITAKEVDGNFLELSVTDTGIGIDSQLLKHLFLPGEQTGRKGTAGEPTTGLGLLICKDFIEKHGGQIRVESTVNKGSAFHFTIPRKLQSPVSSDLITVTEIKEISDPKQEINLLIADDDEISHILITKILGKYFNNIFRTLNGRQTLEFIRERSDINLVMMDIKMPEMDGYETTRNIRQFNKDVVIIAHTAFGFSNEKEVALEAGCNDYIPKPLDSALLFAIIQNHLPYMQIL